ncbi:diphthine--ammonia ligase [Pontibacter sp. SGAir0037]|uniref:Dph6-related ATP pyrophosphatase n=1 Tax=Pontibacter sp. SGAir0037 TaxID=2571030 RepID=UPI0010CCCA48|nr:diphthine--ammonia ligase [Pontibacter sp. SGAir0037]QCR21189.1 ATP-binding protein [Pontibacter sp. SGAir0037]
MRSIFNWSGGKDSALCLHHVLQDKSCQVEALLTTFSGSTNRVTMHGVRQELLVRQAASIDIPLTKVSLPEGVGMEGYNQLMQEAWLPFQKRGITHAIFGDINLEDLRQYRENQLAKVGIKAHFPLWGIPTATLVHDFISTGFKAVVVCVNERLLDGSFAGRMLDEKFLQDLPAGVDPCGENGEFHTFVFDGPIFKEPVAFQLGERVRKTYGPPANADDSCYDKDKAPDYDTGFWFCDLLPA